VYIRIRQGTNVSGRNTLVANFTFAFSRSFDLSPQAESRQQHANRATRQEQSNFATFLQSYEKTRETQKENLFFFCISECKVSSAEPKLRKKRGTAKEKTKIRIQSIRTLYADNLCRSYCQSGLMEPLRLLPGED